MWFLMNNIDLHSIECAIYNVCKHRVLRLRSTDWKSSLTREAKSSNSLALIVMWPETHHNSQTFGRVLST